MEICYWNSGYCPVSRNYGAGGDLCFVLPFLDESLCRLFFFSSRRRHTRFDCDWSSDVCSSDLYAPDGTVGEVLSLGTAPAIVTKRRLRNVNAFETVDAVKTPHAEYGHMALLEVGKGCGRGCRFCLEGQVYRPVRHRSVDALRETVARVAASGEKRVGLVGACVSDYPWIGELLKIVEGHGLELSISSIRADSLTEDLVAALARGGHRTLTMAPEAGTE